MLFTATRAPVAYRVVSSVKRYGSVAMAARSETSKSDGERRVYDRGVWKDAKPCQHCQRVRLMHLTFAMCLLSKGIVSTFLAAGDGTNVVACSFSRDERSGVMNDAGKRFFTAAISAEKPSRPRHHDRNRNHQRSLQLCQHATQSSFKPDSSAVVFSVLYIIYTPFKMVFYLL